VETQTGQADPTVDFARTAFCNGYAVHGPETLTPRARTALGTAEGLLAEYQAPSTLWFIESRGTLEGLYAKIYHRRDRLWMKYDRLAKRWAARLAQDVHADSLVTEILKQTSLEVHESQRDDIKKLVIAAILFAIGQYADLSSEAKKIVAAAQAEGTALGQTAAAALLAFHAGRPIPSLTMLYKENLKQLVNDLHYWQNTDATLQDMIAGLAGDVAQSMGTQVQSGATPGDLNNYVTNTIGAGAGASFYLDSHLHAAFALALLAAIGQSGSLVDFVTVGDERVCPECEAAEAANPWKPAEVPPIPYHGGCRCWYAPAS
jgi:hypothetical protein